LAVRSVQLVNPPTPAGVSRPTRAGCFPPLDLLALASYLGRIAPDSEVTVLDGDLLSFGQIVDAIGADVVGITTKAFTYPQALRIASAAKLRGADVVLGGPWASAVAHEVLENRPFVDCVVVGQGEAALGYLARGLSCGGLPGVWTRGERGRPVGRPAAALDLDALPPLDYRYCSLNEYRTNYARRFPGDVHTAPVSWFSHRGCQWRDVSGGCTYCRRHDAPATRRSPELFWLALGDVVARTKADLVWDVADTFTAPREWLAGVAASRPAPLPCSLYVYARPSDLDPGGADLLAEIGCVQVLMGVESGDDELLRATNKGHTAEEAFRAAVTCADRGIAVFPAFLLGLPGETEASLRATVDLAARIVSEARCREVSSAVLVPLPGTPVYNDLRQCGGADQWRADSDLPDLSRAQREWVTRFTKVDLQALDEANRELQALVPAPGRSTFGAMSLDVSARGA